MRLAVLLAAGALGLAACGSGDGPDRDERSDPRGDVCLGAGPDILGASLEEGTIRVRLAGFREGDELVVQLGRDAASLTTSARGTARADGRLDTRLVSTPSAVGGDTGPATWTSTEAVIPFGPVESGSPLDEFQLTAQRGRAIDAMSTTGETARC